jgi:hypothetical protein
MKTFRLLFVGAGFSKLAGLPLGAELFQEVRRVTTSRYGRDNRVERDLLRFIEYMRNCEGKILTPETVSYEEFLGFLDVEHYLGLKGKDTWSSDGNESQLMVRSAIGQILLERTPTGNNIPSAYRRFARHLTTSDHVLTFNYDTLLEQALELEGIPYRLFPDRYSAVGILGHAIDMSHPDELVLLKLHGSIDWFERSSYDEHVAISEAMAEPYEVKHPIFGSDKIVESSSIVSGVRPANDPLVKIHRVKHSSLSSVYAQPFWQCTPLILAPSSTKIFYAKPLLDFWWGIQRAGGLNLSLGIIGYSMPTYDSYARQALYNIINNFTGYEPNLSFGERSKSKLRILDYRPTQETVVDLHAHYRFVDWENTEVWLDGFSEDGADWILR